MLSCLLSRASSVKKMSNKRLAISGGFKKSLHVNKRRRFDLDEESENNVILIRKDHAIANRRRENKKFVMRLPLDIANSSLTNHAFPVSIDQSWFDVLLEEFKKPYFKQLGSFLDSEKPRYEIFPPKKEIYNWTYCHHIDNTKVVILGQDPYIKPGQAHGLAFSVNPGVPVPKSLVNIYTELAKDIPGFIPPAHGCLYGWADQGVLLLNTCLTVRAGISDSHQKMGWEKLTDAIIKLINDHCSHVVFMLWGKKAQEKRNLISQDKHLILTAAHPSPLSAHRGFFGCKHFSKANSYLRANNKRGINWKFLPED